MNTNPVKVALTARLAGDATLTGMLAEGTAGIYDTLAPQGLGGTAFVVFNKQAGSARYTIGATHAWDEHVYTVKVVAQGASAAAAGTIAARVDTVLNQLPLTTTGPDNFHLRREGDIEYPEVTDGITRWHSGHLYRLYLQGG